MTILTVDNHVENLIRLGEILHELDPQAQIFSFRYSTEALDAARTHHVDIAFLGVRMPELDGLTLGQYLKDLDPYINLVYMTDRREDAFDVMKVRASGCILLPPDKEAVGTELKECRYPVDGSGKKRVFAQTFGNFELFIDGEPVMFKYSRTKEVVAILVNNRGAQTTNGEIIASLWEDEGDPRVKGSYLSNLRQDLQNTLAKRNAGHIILKQRGSMAIAVDRIECDLYEWLEKKQNSRYQYMGDYMNQYSWAEVMHAELDNLSYEMDW